MAAFVGRSELAVQLFMHRRKIVIRQVVKRNLVQEILSMKFKHPENFMPNRPFYKAVGINQMRFWDLYYGRKPITNEEYLSLCDYFGITLQEAFEARQLNIFNNDEL